MDAQFLAGIIIGVPTGAGFMAVVFAWRRWRGAIASVPAARAGLVAELRAVAVLAVLFGVAILAALNQQ